MLVYQDLVGYLLVMLLVMLLRCYQQLRARSKRLIYIRLPDKVKAGLGLVIFAGIQT